MKDRREFFASAFKGLCLCTAGGFLANLSLKADDDYALRPPGAEDEARFLSKCIRCGLCVKACPYNTLKLATLLDSAKNGTPFLRLEKFLVIFARTYHVLRNVQPMLWIKNI
ncbi:Ferredoxin-type protein NapG (periplasmic nitrate reductase) [Campylobacter coli]|nr:Ferredoxin-type protein NapG (periplasmic nitrate reductase) [Campylobacter coli]